MDRLNRFITISILIFFGLLKVFGQIPFSVDIRKITFARNRISYTYSIVFVIIFLSVFFGAGTYNLQFRVEGLTLDGVNGHITKLHYYSKITIAMAISLAQIWNCNQSISCWSNIRSLYLRLKDVSWGIDGYRSDLRKFTLRAIGQLIAHLIANILRVRSIIVARTNLQLWINEFIFTLPILMISLCSNTFAVCAICLARGLMKINVDLYKEVKNVNRWSSASLSNMEKVSVRMRTCQKIEEQKHHYSEAYKVIRQITELYSSMVFLIVSFLFLNIIAEVSKDINIRK